MRPRFLISVLFLAMVILAIIFWWRSVRPPSNAERPQAIVQFSNAPTRTASIVNKNYPSAAAAPTQKTPVNQGTVVTHKIETPEQAKQEIESANVPIDFYGQVIDQNSNALAGVDIKVSVRHWAMPDPSAQLAGSRDIQLERTTGTDGRFEINGVAGDVMNLESIEKNGYKAELGQRNFGASIGSYDNPVIFKMWSDNVHEKLITGQKAFPIVPDGRPYFINLTDGTISESGTGDLRVWIKRPAQITYGQRYDWSCDVSVVNGGLLEEPAGSAMYEAPADGYVPSFVFNQNIGSGWGDATGMKYFYVDLSNGHEHGSIAIELCAYYNDQIPGLVRLSYVINPSGSRILR